VTETQSTEGVQSIWNLLGFGTVQIVAKHSLVQAKNIITFLSLPE